MIYKMYKRQIGMTYEMYKRLLAARDDLQDGTWHENRIF